MIGTGGGKKFQFESIHPPYANQPSTDPPPGMERLDYTATNCGQVSLIAEGELPVAWWTDGGAERPANVTYPGESFSNEATEGVHAGLVQTTEAAVMPRLPNRDEKGADSTVSGGEMDIGGLQPMNPIGSAALEGSSSLPSMTAKRQWDKTGPLENRKRRRRDREGPHGVKHTVPPEEGFPPQPIPQEYLRLDKGCDNCTGIDGPDQKGKPGRVPLKAMFDQAYKMRVLGA
ncbi:hypothetical protein K466DRAFT_570783 [Polyporus arcularius HHB13444]|uniref:Uncharacterized protein n=1 Tax=Polyporus arcularius HHB13444 TaxID=1314778 RepID=A0A5C3NMS1_9APHY|nr:hypothetical protein K466DRAFT_570783 [Polyporus arcularius HHB13444]